MSKTLNAPKKRAAVLNTVGARFAAELFAEARPVGLRSDEERANARLVGHMMKQADELLRTLADAIAALAKGHNVDSVLLPAVSPPVSEALAKLLARRKLVLMAPVLARIEGCEGRQVVGVVEYRAEEPKLPPPPRQKKPRQRKPAKAAPAADRPATRAELLQLVGTFGHAPKVNQPQEAAGA